MSPIGETFIETGCGHSVLEDSFEAGAEAARQALSGLVSPHPSVAIVFTSVRYNLPDLLRGATSVLGDVPLIGTTTEGEVLGDLRQERIFASRDHNGAVSVLLLGRELSRTALLAQENEALRRELEMKNAMLHESVLEKTRRLQETSTSLEKETASHRAAESRVHFMVLHDPLTGLPNRNLFANRLRQALALAKRHGNPVMVALVNLDQFKWIEDSFGREVGDEILKGLSGGVSACLRGSDTFACFDRDEFALLLQGGGSPEEFQPAVHRILDCISQSLHHPNRKVQLTSSIGCSLFPDDGQDAESLLRAASVATRRAREKGGGCVQLYNPEMQKQVDERALLEMSLGTALEDGRLSLVYQLQVEAETGRIVGTEALLRWHDPALGEIPPSRFIPIAEATGLIEPIGAWVLRQACLQAKAWQEAGLPPIQMAVNLSARQLRRPGFESLVEEVLAETKLDPGCLELELTEKHVPGGS